MSSIQSTFSEHKFVKFDQTTGKKSNGKTYDLVISSALAMKVKWKKGERFLFGYDKQTNTVCLKKTKSNDKDGVLIRAKRTTKNPFSTIRCGISYIVRHYGLKPTDDRITPKIKDGDIYFTIGHEDKSKYALENTVLSKPVPKNNINGKNQSFIRFSANSGMVISGNLNKSLGYKEGDIVRIHYAKITKQFMVSLSNDELDAEFKAIVGINQGKSIRLPIGVYRKYIPLPVNSDRIAVKVTGRHSFSFVLPEEKKV